MNRKSAPAAGTLATVAWALALILIPEWIPGSATAAPGGTVLQKVDTDHDGTIDLNEVKAAASVVFDRADRDHDGTLDARELKGRLSAKELAAGDPDHDGTLSKSEYLDIVAKYFSAAESDGDGTLDGKEMRSAAGRALTRLIQ